MFLIVNFALPRILPGPFNIYVVQPLLWSYLGLLSFLGWKYTLSDRPLLKKPLVFMAILIGAAQVALFLIAGLLFGFGYSPYSHHSLALLGNLAYVGSTLVGLEMSRAYLMAVFSRRNTLLALVGAALIFSFLSIPIAKLGLLGNPSTAFRVFGETLLPLFAENFLASFLSLIGGPMASIAYMGTLQAFEWLSPILPDLQWTVTAFLGTMSPATGLLVMQSKYHSDQTSKREIQHSYAGSSTAWLLVAATVVALLWFNTGLCGVQPTLVSGVSMKPALLPGDLVITKDVSADAIELGDIIRFRQGNSFTLHRVVEVQRDGGDTWLITRGDANNVNDFPVPESQLGGKVVFVIPKVGWVSIGLRRLIELIR